MLLFMSSHSQRSPYISKEITCVIAKRKHIVCVVLDGCEVQGAFELMLCDTQIRGIVIHYDDLICHIPPLPKKRITVPNLSDLPVTACYFFPTTSYFITKPLPPQAISCLPLEGKVSP